MTKKLDSTDKQRIDEHLKEGIETDSVHTDKVNNVNQVQPSDDLQTQIDNEGASTRHVLAPGDHDLGTSTVLVNYDNVEIVGPHDAILKLGSSTTSTFLQVGKDTSITHFLARGFTIDGTNQTMPSTLGNHNSKDGHGILFDEHTNSSVTIRDYRCENLQIKKTKNEGIAHVSGNKTNPGNSHGVITDCLFEACEGYAAHHCHNDNTITVENCTFRDCSNIEHIIRHGKIRGNTFENCTLTDVDTNTPSIQAVIVGSAAGGITADNFIHNCDATIGIAAAGSGEQIHGNLLLNNTLSDGIKDAGETAIHGNRVKGSGTTYGIRVLSADADVRDNRITETGERSLIVNSNNNSVRDNTIVRAGQSANREGLVVESGTSGNIVKDNEVRGSTRSNGLVCYAGPNRVVGNNVEKDYSFSASSILARENNRAGTVTFSGSTPSITWYDETVLLDGSSNSVDATLPDPTLYPGETITIKAIDVTNAVSYSQNGTETIDGSASQSFSSQYEVHQVKSDGTNWHIVTQ